MRVFLEARQRHPVQSWLILCLATKHTAPRFPSLWFAVWTVSDVFWKSSHLLAQLWWGREFIWFFLNDVIVGTAGKCRAWTGQKFVPSRGYKLFLGRPKWINLKSCHRIDNDSLADDIRFAVYPGWISSLAVIANFLFGTIWLLLTTTLRLHRFILRRWPGRVEQPDWAGMLGLGWFSHYWIQRQKRGRNVLHWLWQPRSGRATSLGRGKAKVGCMVEIAAMGHTPAATTSLAATARLGWIV